MDIILPGAAELAWGLLFLLAQVIVAGLVAWDLRRRDVTAWWFVGVVTVFMMPLGLIGWIVLRKQESQSPA
ncbi:MAG: hypothetical protein R3320_09215 [Nitriliruptorales bacterium]|nr:hypothetical protein [Nitriliruptorales bacterium]